MRTRFVLIAAIFAAALYGAAQAGAQSGAAPPSGLPGLTLPAPGDDEELPIAPRRRAPHPAQQIGPPQKSAAEPDGPPNAPPEELRKQKLDDLFTRLAASRDADETAGLLAAIDRAMLETGSDTDDFLMTRAVAAMGSKNLDAALALLDRLVEIDPDWAEAWNKRATVRFMAGDQSGSMADIAQTIQREPRHFGALSGMGMILEQRGFRASALRAYRRVLEIAPQMASAKAAVERLEAAERGQGL